MLREHEADAKTADLVLKRSISETTLYNWMAKCGGMDVSEAKWLEALEGENAELKKPSAESILDTSAHCELCGKW